MTSLMHTYMAHIPTISGIDIALWDLAGKITGVPVCTLLGGPFRESIRMYSHGVNLKMLDKNSCRDFAARVKSMPEGFNAFKCGIDEPLGVPTARFTGTLDQAQLRTVARAFNNVREALGRRYRNRRALPRRVRRTERRRHRQGRRTDEPAVHRRSAQSGMVARLAIHPAADSNSLT